MMDEMEVKDIAQAAAREAVREFLIALGIDSSDPIKMQHQMSSLGTMSELLNDEEYQADQLHLREWRVAMENAKRTSFFVVVTTIVSGFIGLMVFGIKMYLQKGPIH